MNPAEYVIVEGEPIRTSAAGLVVTLGHKDANGEWDDVRQYVISEPLPEAIAAAIEAEARERLATELASEG